MKELTKAQKRRNDYDELRLWARNRRGGRGKNNSLLKRFRYIIATFIALILVCVVFPFLVVNNSFTEYKYGKNSFENTKSLDSSKDVGNNLNFVAENSQDLNRFKRVVDPKVQDQETTTAVTTIVPETTATTLAAIVDDTTADNDNGFVETTMATTMATTMLVGNARVGMNTTAAIIVDTTSTTPANNDDTERIIFISVAAGLGTLALILLIAILIFCFCPCACCFACFCCKKYRPTPAPEMLNMGTVSVAPPEIETNIPEAWVVNEERLRDAMEVGRTSVLEFTLQEVRWLSESNIDEELISEAEDKLNIWKRNTNMLSGAVKSKDVPAIKEYMKRFRNLDIHDESGMYERGSELLEDLDKSLLLLDDAARLEDESAITEAFNKLNSLGISSGYLNKLDEVQNANLALSAIQQKKILEGKTEKEIESFLKESIEQRNGPDIKKAISQIEEAEITSLDPLVQEGKKVLEELEKEWNSSRDAAWQNLMDASMNRDAVALGAALSECETFGIEKQAIHEGEKLLKTVEREDQLLKEIADLIDQRDASKLPEAITVFRTPGLSLVDKTGDVAKAEELLQELKEKERLERAKGDAMWRLQNARDLGDVAVMENMIKALESLASLGEEIDEAMLLRAKTELETIRGEVDYRKRMESIKSAISRMISAESLPQLADLIEQMAELSTNKDYTMTADDSRVLNESRDTLHKLQRKQDILNELDITRPVFSLPQIPNSLDKLKSGVEIMTKLKESAAEFDGVFGPDDSDLLATATLDTNRLEEKVEKMKLVQSKLQAAVEAKDHPALLAALAEARKTEFIDPEEIAQAQIVCDFINPKKRITALKIAFFSRKIPNITEEIDSFIKAGVKERQDLLEKSQRRLRKLNKAEKNERKEENRRKQDEARKKAEVDELNEKLKVAIESRDIEQLRNALKDCEDWKYPEDEIPLFKEADNLLDELMIERLRQNLMQAIERRDIFVLEKSIDEADYGGYVEDLGEMYKSAKDLLFHLRELHKLREAISGMNRSLMSEISRYPNPPYPVGIVMTATMIMLGEKKSNISKWQFVQKLLNKLGNESVTRRVKRLAPGDVTVEIREEVEKMLQGLDLASVKEKSSSAGSFFAWMKCMIKESYYASRPDYFQPTSMMPHLVSYE